MVRFLGQLSRLVCILGVVCGPGFAVGAEIELRPDLLTRFAALSPVYPNGDRFAPAGPLYQSSDAEPPLVIKLSGVIEPGDAERLKRAMEGNDPNKSWQEHFIILDSPGGSLLEGIRLGNAMRVKREGNGGEELLGVLVQKGERCLSACAVAFVLSATTADAGRSARFVEQGARLGFHMPSLPPDKASQRAEVEAAMNLTFDTMREYLRIVGNGIAPTALVTNALFYRGADQFFTLQGGLVTRFMDFVPVAEAPMTAHITVSGLSQDHVLRMCNYLVFSEGRNMSSQAHEIWRLTISSEREDKDPLRAIFERLGQRRIAMPECAIEWLPGDVLGLGVTGFTRLCAEEFDTGWCPVEEGRSLPPTTAGLLADALDCHGGRLSERVFGWDWGNQFLDEEEPWEPGAELGRELSRDRVALANVRLREAPGLDGTPVGTLRKGDAVTLEECALRADGQGVWFRMRAGALSGWGSGRYVSAPDREMWFHVVRPVGFE